MTRRTSKIRPQIRTAVRELQNMDCQYKTRTTVRVLGVLLAIYTLRRLLTILFFMLPYGAAHLLTQRF